jgi:signal transduction histidine kinase
MPDEPRLILLVVGQPAEALSLQALLAGAEWDTQLLNTAEPAAERLRDEDVVLFLIDLAIPGALELGTRIRSSSIHRRTPIIFLTGELPDGAQLARGYALHSVDFHPRTLPPALLKQKIHALAAQSSRADRLRTFGQDQVITILETIADAFYALDTEWRYTYVNRQCEMYYNKPRSEVLGRVLWDLVPAVVGTIFEREYRRAMREQVPVHFEGLSPLSFLWLEVHAYPTPDGLAVYTRDITARKIAQEEVGKLTADLERRVIERTTQLEAANKELEAFSYSVSHDLRSPLRSIAGFSHILMEDLAEQLDPEARSHLTRIKDAAHRMSELIDGLLKLSRLSRRELNRETVDLTSIALGVGAELQDPSRLTELLIEPDLTAHADAQLVRVLLENLLGNAFKFSARRETPQVQLGRDPESPNAFFVRDNGAGFNMRYAEKLFGTFQRLHSVSEFPGTGIGLATVQRVAHLHGGRVWAEGEVDKGATFRFTLEPDEVAQD